MINKSVIATIVVSQKMPQKQLSLHKKVIEKFLPPNVDYVQYESPKRLTNPHVTSSCNHAGNIDRIIRAKEYDNYLFLEIDAIPIRSSVLEELLERSAKGELAGVAQRTQWPCEDENHLYVGPCALAISKETYIKMGEPTSQPTPHGDTAAEFTYICEKMNIPVFMSMPVATDGPKKWRLKDNLYYGPGTTYDIGIWHKFGENLGLDAFYNKCESIL